MDESTMKHIFLSASIPIPGRDDERYLETADVIAIRDAVIALASVALPEYHLVLGGHPSITPLIADVLVHSNVAVNENVTLYQSYWYKDRFPEENHEIGKKVFTEKGRNKKESLCIMREKMIGSYNYVAGIFIGGMDGVEVEYQMFCEMCPDAKVFPVASTGAAAKILFDNDRSKFDPSLENDLAYASIFKKLLF